MSKKKNKNKHDYDHDLYSDYAYKKGNEIADALEKYLETIVQFFIIQVPPEKFCEARDTISKAIKNLRKGKLDKVFDMDAFLEYINRDDVDSDDNSYHGGYFE